MQTRIELGQRSLTKSSSSQKRDRPQRLKLLAEKLVAMAIDGDLAAMKEIGNRIDGRALSSIQVSPETDGDPAGNINFETDVDGLILDYWRRVDLVPQLPFRSFLLS